MPVIFVALFGFLSLLGHDYVPSATLGPAGFHRAPSHEHQAELALDDSEEPDAEEDVDEDPSGCAWQQSDLMGPCAWFDSFNADGPQQVPCAAPASVQKRPPRVRGPPG